MGDTQSAQRDGKEDAVEDTGGGRPQDSEDINVEEKLNKQQNNRQISGLHGKSDDPLAELNDHLEDELIDDGCDTESALVSAREGVSDSYAMVDNRDRLLEDVEINDTDPHTETALSEKEDTMNEINKGFRRFFSNIGLKLTVKQGADEKPAEVASDVPVLPNPEEEPCSPGETCDVANESMSKTSENVADHHTALDSADNESTTCPTVTDMTSEDIHENVEDKTTGSTEVDQGAAEATLSHADTEGVTVEVEPGTSSPQESAEEEVLSPIKVFFTTGIFSSLKKKKKPAEEEREEEKQKQETNEKELVDMDREEQGGQEEIEKNLGKAKDEVCPSAESAVVEEKQKTEEGIEEAIPEPAPTTNGHGIGENLVNDNEVLLTSEEKAQSQSSPLQRLFSRTSFRKGSTKQQGRKDSTECVPVHLPSSAGLAESLPAVSPEMAPEEVKKSEESAWETLKRLLTPKKFQKSPPLSNEEAVISSTPEEPKASEGEEIPDANTEESKKRKDSIVSWDALLCGSGNRRSRKSSYADEQKPRTEGDDNKPAIESRHAADHDSSHEMDDNIASSPEQGGSNSEDEGSTWKSFKRLVTPKRKSRDGEETKEHTSDSEIIQDEPSFSLKKFIPGRKKQRPSEKQEQVPSDKPEREEHSDEEDSETPAIIPFHEFDIPETECQVITQAVIESQTPEGEDHKGQEDVTGQTTEEIAMSENTKDTETALENQTTTTPASMEEGDDLTEFVSKLQQLSDIPEEGLIEESVATPASFADDAARDDTIADIIEFTSEAVTAPEPVDITVEDETEMVSAVSRLTDSSKTSGNTTPVPADYDAKETDNLLHQVVESISATANEALVSASDQCPERIAGSVSRHILETSIPKELTILKPHQTPDGTFSSTGFTVEAFDAFDRDAEAEGLSDMTEAIYTQCLSEDTTEEFHTAAISVDEELQYISESQRQLYSSSKENKALTSAVLPQAEDVNVAEISIDNQKNDNEQANDMAPPGTDSHVEATIQTDNNTLVQKNEALEDINDQVKDSITDDEAQVQSDDMVDESETLTLTDACVSMNSEEVSGAQADEMPATSETTPTEETVKVSELLSCEQMQDVPVLSVGDEAQRELLVAPVEPEEVIIEADKGNSQLQSCSSVDITQVEQGSVQDLESQSEDIPVQDPTVPDSSITSTEGEGVAIDQMQHTSLETEKHTEILQDALVEGGNQTAKVTGELQTETSVEETDVYCEESNGQVLEQKVITDDSSERDEEKHDEKESVTQPEQSLTEKDLATVENEPMEVPQHISVEEDGQLIEVRNELEKVTSDHMTSVNHDVTIIRASEKQVITEDNAECQAENALPLSTSEVEKEAAEVSEPGLEEEELVSIMNYPCDEHRQVTDELETISVASVISDVQLLEKQLITEDIVESQAEEAKSEVEKEAAEVSEPGLEEEELVSIMNYPCDERRQVTDELETISVASVISDVQLLEKQLITEDIVESQAEEAKSEVEKEAAEVSEPCLEEEEIVSITNYPCEEPRQVTDELETLSSLLVASVISDVQLLEKQSIPEDIAESQAEEAKSEVEKEAVIVSEQYCAEKELASIENDPGDEPRQVQVQVTNDEFETSQSVQVSTVNSEVRNVEVDEKQVISEDIGSNTENALSSSTSEVEKEAAEVSEPCLEEEEIVSITNYPCEEPRQVTDELETLSSPLVASVISDVQLLQKQSITEDIAESQAEEAKSEVEKEAVIVSEQYCAEKELASIENDPGDEPRQVQVTNDDFETSQSVQVSTVNSEVRNVEVDEKQKISEDIIGFNSENDSTSITDEDEKETITQSVQSLLENEFVTVENDQREVPWQIQDSGPIIEVRNELEKPNSVHVASVNCDASVQSLENQTFTEDSLDSFAENALPTSRSEVAEQGLVDEQLTSTENDCHVSQDILVQEDAPLTEVGNDLETLDQNVAYLNSKVGVAKVLEKQLLTEDNAASQAENTLPLSVSEVKKEATTVSEHDVADKKLVSQENDPGDVLLAQEDVLVQEDVKLTVTGELETLTSVHGGSLNSEARIVEVHEKQVTPEDLGSNAENTNSWIIVENENKTAEQSLLAKELATVESDSIEEPQHISVTDDIQVTEVTQELEALTSAHEASVDSNAAIIEVLEKQVVSGEIPEPDAFGMDAGVIEALERQIVSEALGSNAENASTLITVEDEKETVTVTQPEQSLFEKELVSEEPQHISFTDGQVPEITKESEASVAQVASVDSDTGIVKVEKQVLSEDIPVPDGASASVTAEVENETGALTEHAEKEPPTLDDDPKEIPQQSMVNDGEEVKASEFEAPSTVQITNLIMDSSIVEVIQKRATSEDQGSNADNANTLITVEDEKEIHSEEQLLETELVTVESNVNEEPQHISVTDVLDAEVTKELEALTSLHVASVGSNAGIVEVLEPVLNEASILVTAEVENETGVLIEQALEGPTVDDNLYDNVKDGEAVKVSTEFEVPPTDQIALLISESSIVEDGCLREDIQVTDVEKASASMTAEAEKEAAALIEHVLVENEHITVLEDPDEVQRQCTVQINDEFADIAKEFDGSTEVHIASITTDSTPQVLEKQDLSENILAPEDNVALVVPEPSHEVEVSIGANVGDEIDEPVEVETNQELVEDGAAMQNEAGAAMQAFTCGATYVETSMLENGNTEMPDSTEPLLDVVTTDKEHKETIEPVRVLETCVQEDMIDMEEERKGDAEVKSAEEVGVTDANEAMDVSCEVENEVENISTSLATEEEIIGEMDNVTAKELDQQVNQTQVPEELAKESCLEEEPVSEVQIVVTPPTVEQEVTEMTQSEPSELEAQKVTENKSDASIERHPEILSVTEIGNEEQQETSSIHVLVTTDDVSIVKPKTDLDLEDSSCSPAVLAGKETTEAQEEQTYSSHMVTPSSTGIVVPEIIISSEKEPTIQKEVTELVTELRSEPVKQAQVSEVEVQVEEDEVPEIQMEGTEFQATEEEEQNIEITATEIKVTERSEGVVQAIEAIDIEENKAELKKELYVHVIDDSSCSPQEVVVEDMIDAKQEQTHPSQVLTEVADTQEIEVTELVKELDSIPVASQADTDQVEIVFLSETVQCHTVVDPLETTPPHVAHIEQAERTLPSGQPAQSEVDVEAAKPVPRGEEELDQDIWLDAEEDVGKQEGAEQAETEPRESLESQVESCKGDHKELEFLDTAKHAEEDSRPEEIEAVQEKYELESEGEDFDFAMEDSDIMNQAETSLMCKELD